MGKKITLVHQKLLDLKLDENLQHHLYQIYMDIMQSFLKFRDNFLNNRYICFECILRIMIKKSLDWERVIRTKDHIHNLDYSISQWGYEWFIHNFMCQCGNKCPTDIITIGMDEIKVQEVKDKNIDLIRLFNMMNNILMKEILEKILDKMNQSLYNLSVPIYNVHTIMDYLLFPLMRYIPEWTHTFDEVQNIGMIYVFKCLQNTSLSSEDPIIIKYHLRKES